MIVAAAEFAKALIANHVFTRIKMHFVVSGPGISRAPILRVAV